MSDWKRVYLTVFCVLFFSCILYGYAEVRNVSISSECYNPGEEITISFEVRSTSAYQNIYGSIIFSENTTPVYTGETRRGINHIVWDLKNDLGMDAANGIYMLRVFAEEKVITKKIAVIR